MRGRGAALGPPLYGTMQPDHDLIAIRQGSGAEVAVRIPENTAYVLGE